MKSLAFESIRNACFNLERLSRSFRLAQPEFRLWNDFGTALIQTPNFSAVYKSGTGTRGQGRGDACVGTWDLGTSSMGRGDAGTSKSGTQGTRDVNEYRKSRR